MKRLSELTNLLPADRVRAFRRRYFLRLGTVAISVFICVVLLHGVLLIPSFLYAHGEVVRGADQLSQLNAQTQSVQEQQAAARTQALTVAVGYLGKLQKTPTASAPLRAILAVPRPGIALTAFTYTAPSGNIAARMQISGIADSRDQLRAYVTALGQLPFVTSADLPLSAYAQDNDIDFTVTVTGTLQP